MIYAVSDVHGCYDKYKALLKKINLGPDDTLYVLGDVIDRGPDGFKIMLDMAQQSNVVNLLGNHEAMALNAIPRILAAAEENGEVTLTGDDARVVKHWFQNGGEFSLTDFLRLNGEQGQIVWKYMRDMPLYKEVEAGGQQYVLVHGGLGGFSPSRPLDDYAPDEILWCRPEEDTVYYPDKYVVFGHTPVQLVRPGKPAKIYRRNHWINIDCGCVYRSGRLACLCLDTMEDIYV